MPAANEVLWLGPGEKRWWNTNSIHVIAGIENDSGAENTGNPTDKLTVPAIVPASGHPIIQDMFGEGKPSAKAMKH